MAAVIRVLYVDDEPSLLDIGKLFLEEGGLFSVDIISSAPDALNLLNEKNYNAIISDYEMPGMNGIEFLKSVRTSGNTIPFILFTGRGREEVVIQALNEGADFYLQKGGEPVAQFTELAHKTRQAIQQRRAEASIRDHERRETDIINFLPDATFAINLNGVVISWNRAMEEMTGIRGTEMLGKGNYEYSIPLYHERRPILIDLILHDDPAIAAKYPSLKKDGKVLVAEAMSPFLYNGKGAVIWFTAAPLYNNKGDVVGAIESIRDISDRKLAEDAQKINNEHLHMAQEIGQTGSWELDLTTGKIWGSEEAFRIFEILRPTDGILSLEDVEARIPERDRVHRALTDLLEKGMEYNIEYEIETADNTRNKIVHSVAKILKDANKKPVRIIGITQDITARKRADEVLKESEGRFREHYQNNPIATFTWQHRDGDFVLIDCNKAAIALTNGRSNNFIGKTASDMYATRPDIITLINQSFSERTGITMELVSEHFLPGRLISTVTSYVPPDMIMVHMEDITERKQAEEKLLEAQSRTATVLEGIADTFYSLDDKWRFTTVNPAAEKAPFKRPASELLGRVIWEVYPGLVGTYIHQHYLDAAKNFTMEHYEGQSPLNGRWYEVFMQGRRGGVDVYMRDITEKKRAEEALAKSEGLLKTLVTNLHGVVFSVDREGIFLVSDGMSLSSLGLKPGQVVGQSVFDVYKDVPEIVAGMKTALTGKTWSGITHVQDIFFDTFVIPIFDNSKMVSGAVGIATDITYRIWAEQELVTAQQRLKEAHHLAHIGTWDWVIATDTVTWSDELCNIAGWDPSHPAPTYAELPRVYTPASWSILNDAVTTALTTGESYNLELEMLRPDGSIRWTNAFGGVQHDVNGKVIGLYGTVQDITERKREEEALRESEERYRSLYEDSRDAIIILSSEGRFIAANPATIQLFAIKDEQNFIACSPASVSPEYQPDGILSTVKSLDMIRLALEKGSNFFEWTHRKSDGTNFPATVLLSRLESSGMQLLQATVRDITERKVAEEALKAADREIRQSKDMFRAFLDHSYDAVLIHDAGGKLLDVNATMLRLYRVTREEAFKYTIADYTGPANTMDEAQEHWARALAGEDQLFFWQARRPNDGSVFDVEVYLTNITIDDHQIILGNIRDITEHKQAEKELFESQERYSSLFSNNYSVSLLIDPNTGRIVDANAAACDYYGYSHKQLEGMGIYEINRQDKDKVIRNLSRAKKERHFFSTHYLADGKQRNVEIYSGPILVKGETLFYSIIHDVTDKVKAEEALREANKKLNLLSSITRHDINNQLSVLQGYLRILEKKQTDPTLIEYFQKAAFAAQRISAMIQFTKEYESIGVTASVWQDCRIVIDTAAKQTPLGNVIIKNDLPMMSEIFADPLIVKVFYNLIDNAVRYGGKITTIRFSVEESGDDHIVICKDDGVGVIAEEKEKIFEKGYGKNTGMGLFLAREILDITGITIRETGEPGKGARFEMTVPKGMWRTGIGA